jgi:hypothetical protein
MTVTATDPRAGPYTGNGVTTDFAFSFKVFEAGDLRVVHSDSDDIETDLVLDSGYSVTLNVDQNNSPGGSITYKAAGVTTALPTGETLTILSDLEYTQETDIQNAGGFLPEVIENALDRSVMLAKQAAALVSRAVQLPPATSNDVDITLPVPEALKVLGWNAAADALVNLDPTTGQIGELIAELANATSASLGAGLVKSKYDLIYPVKSLGLASYGRPPSTWAMTDAEVADVLSNTGSMNVAAALNTIIDTGYEIDFTPGTYGISVPLTPTTQQTLKGRKREKAIIKALAGFAGSAMVSYPSGAYSGVTIEYLKLNANSIAARCLEMIGVSQGAVDQIILRDVAMSLATARPLHLENLTYWELDHVITNGGTDGAFLKTCYSGASKNCVHYHGARAALILENCSDNALSHFVCFNNPGTPSTSLLEVDGGHGNVFRDYTLEPQGAANVTQELLINDTVGGNCVGHEFISGQHIGLANTKTRSVVIGASGAIYQSRFENTRIIKPTGNESVLLTAQAETQFVNCRDLAAYDTPTFSALTILNNSGNPYRTENLPGQFSALSTEGGLTFPATQVPSSDANTLDDYQENLATPLDAMTITGSTGDPTTLAAAGGFQAQAIKVGRLVHLKHNFGAITWAAPGTGTFRINLPFAINGMAKVQGTLFATAVVGEINGTVLTLYAAGSATALTWASIGASGSSLILDITGHTTA